MGVDYVKCFFSYQLIWSNGFSHFLLNMMNYINQFSNVKAALHIWNKPQQAVGTTQMSFHGEWITRLWYIHTIEYYLAIQRNILLTHTTTMIELKGNMLSKRSQSQRVRYCMTTLVKYSDSDKIIVTEKKSMDSRH